MIGLLAVIGYIIANVAVIALAVIRRDGWQGWRAFLQL